MRTIIMIMILQFCFHPVFSQDPRVGKPSGTDTWKVINEQKALFTNDHFTIEVWPPFNHFQKLKLKVSGAPLRLIKLKVVYSDGAPDVLPLNMEILDGKVSHIINLRSAGIRSIRRIDFWYNARELNHHADVMVLALIN